MLPSSITSADVDSYKWRNRLLLIFAPSPEHSEYQEQTRMNWGRAPGLVERDLVIGEVFEDGDSHLGEAEVDAEKAEALRERFDVAPGSFKVVLIGKDGTVKMDQAESIETYDLFMLIDSMPMRQREMARKNTW